MTAENKVPEIYTLHIAGLFTKKELHDLFYSDKLLIRRGYLQIKNRQIDVQIRVERLKLGTHWYFTEEYDRKIDAVFDEMKLDRSNAKFYLDEKTGAQMDAITDQLEKDYINEFKMQLEDFLKNNTMFKLIEPIKEYHANNLEYQTTLQLSMKCGGMEINNGEDLLAEKLKTQWIELIDNPADRNIEITAKLIDKYGKNASHNITLNIYPSNKNEVHVRCNIGQVDIKADGIGEAMKAFAEASLNVLENF